MSSDTFLKNLNPPQLEAVMHIDGPLLILAGAGSGKTRVLTHRIAHLMNQGLAPEQVLAVTFTNKAAGEMRERVERLLSVPLNGFWISTFHSTCLRILRREGQNLGLPRDFMILDEKDSLGLIRKAIADFNLNEESYPPKQIEYRIDRAKGDGKGPEEFTDPEFSAATTFGKIYTRYQEMLREAKGLDFGDLLIMTVELFRKCPDVLTRFQSQFRHVLVDEYQDTNRVQYDFLRLLCRSHQNLCVVGDEDQSIYGWRGADLRNILDFERDFPQARVIRLEQNYRSTKRIIGAASALIAKNRLRKGKKLWTARAEGHPIFSISSRNERYEASAVASLVENLLSKDSFTAGDIAVFYRTNAQSRLIEDELSRRRIAYQLVGGLRFYERKEIKDAISYLRASLNPEESLSLRRIINVPARGIGKSVIGKVEEIGSERGLSFATALRAGREEKLFSPAAERKLDVFFQILNKFHTYCVSEPFPEALHRILKESGYLGNLENERTEEARARLENLGELINAARDFWERNEGGILEYLDQAALVSDIDELEGTSRTVKLLTLHNAKGLEFPVVIIAGLEDNLLPHLHSSHDEEELEEERRLFYVGMTRAKDRLFLFQARERRFFGVPSFSRPSRFLADIPREFVEVIVQP
jgi:DNA helicase-2/ATP-dependent DNA helicase PcrA